MNDVARLKARIEQLEDRLAATTTFVEKLSQMLIEQGEDFVRQSKLSEEMFLTNRDRTHEQAEATLRMTGLFLGRVVDLLCAQGSLDRDAFNGMCDRLLSQGGISIDPNENPFGWMVRALLTDMNINPDERA